MKTITIQDWGAIAAILTALITGLYFLHKEFKKKQHRYRQLLNGQWGNEGCIGGDPETHYVDLDLTVDEEDGSVTGSINSRDLTEDQEMSFMVSGDIFYKSVRLDVTKVRMGNVHEYGSIRLTFKNKRNILLTKRKDVNDFFPERTVVFKS